MLERLDDAYRLPGDVLLGEWRSALDTLGRRVRVQVGDRSLEGEAVGVDERGSLVLQPDDGPPVTLTAGEVTLQEPAAGQGGAEMVTAQAIGIMEAKPPYAQQDERAVVRLWSNAHNLSEGVRAEDGRFFRVLYPGRPGGGPGPDFRDAVLQTESGATVLGDVEVHVEESGWRAHGHHVDPGYNGVVLHLVLHTLGRKATRQQSGAGAPVVRLPDEASEESLGPLPEPFAALLGGGSIGGTLDRAGDRRFMARSAGFRAQLEREDPDETAYGAVMEALGYAANRRPFRELSRRVPFIMLMSMRGEPDATRLLALEAMLVRGAGLLPLVDPERAVRFAAVLDHLPPANSIPSGMWRTAGVRPANHPLRRLTGAARILDRHLERGIMRGLAEAAARGSRPLTDALSAKPYVGVGRAREVSATAALPLVHAWAGMRRDLELEGLCLETYRGFPKLQENAVTREMSRLLARAGALLGRLGARRHQGLIQVYKEATTGAQAGGGRATAPPR